jgi:hypothetical protein
MQENSKKSDVLFNQRLFQIFLKTQYSIYPANYYWELIAIEIQMLEHIFL